MDLVIGRNRIRVIDGEGLEVRQDLSTPEKYMELFSTFSCEEAKQVRDWLTANVYLMEKRDAPTIE